MLTDRLTWKLRSTNSNQPRAGTNLTNLGPDNPPMLRRVGKIKIRKIGGLGLRGVSKISQTSCAHSRLWSTAAGTARRSPGRVRPRAGPLSVRELGEPRPVPGPAPPAGTRLEPGSAPRRVRVLLRAGSQSPPLPSLPAPHSQQDAAARRAESGLSCARREDSGSRPQGVAHLSYLHPPRPTSFPCPRPLSCSPRFRRSPPPSHRDGSSPSYPLENGLAFSSRAVVSHSRRPAQPLPLQ